MPQYHTTHKKIKKMSDEDISRVLNAYIDDALESYEGDLQETRIQALNFYEGHKFGNEVDGCSDIVLTQFRDIVEFMMPPMMRLFTSPRNPAKFLPNGPDAEEMAKQATDYVSHILWWDNDGYNIIQDWLKNGMIYRLGVLKWWWEDEEKIVDEEYSGLGQEELDVLLGEEGVELQSLETSIQYTTGPDGQQIEVPVMDVEITRTSSEGRVVIHNLAPEEFIYNRTAESLDTARFMAHRQLLTVSELIARDYDVDTVMSLPIADEDYSEEREHRHEEKGGTDRMDYDSPDPSLDKKLIYECYCYMDADGDGHAEYKRIVTGDRGNVILEEQNWECAPFAAASPLTMPNELTGKSIGDLTMDIQFITSQIVRQSLDGLVHQNNPRKVVVEDAVDMDDVYNNEVGGTIRADAPGMVEWLQVPAVAQQGLPFLEYMNSILERRTGISETSMGLNADSLQSTTEFAVTAQLTASQGKIELIARNFANALSTMYMGILRTICQHQNKERVIKLRGEWIPMDPRHWEADLKATPIVGLGSGTEREKMVYMSQIISEQKELVLAGSDLSSEQLLYNSYEDMIDMGGFKNADRYFADPAKQPPKPPQPDPMQQQMQMEQQKMQMEMQMELQKAKMQAEVDMQKAQMDAQIKFQTEMIKLRIEAETNAAELESETELKRRELAIEAAFKAAELSMEAIIAEKKSKLSEKEVNLNFNANMKSPVAA